MSEQKTTAEWLDEQRDTPLGRAWIEGPAPALRQAVAGRHTVEVTEVARGETSAQMSMPDGTSTTRGISLGELRKRFGGDEGHVTNPLTGETVAVSLARWKGRDPDSTIISIRVRFREQR